MDGDDDGGGSAIDGDEGDNLENDNEFSADKELLFQQRHEALLHYYTDWCIIP